MAEKVKTFEVEKLMSGNLQGGGYSVSFRISYGDQNYIHRITVPGELFRKAMAPPKPKLTAAFDEFIIKTYDLFDQVNILITGDPDVGRLVRSEIPHHKRDDASSEKKLINIIGVDKKKDEEANGPSAHSAEA